jgi:BASS family bile acid:Na+ symporter
MKFLKHNIWAVVSIGFAFSLLFPALGTLVSPFLHILFMILTFFSTIDIKIPEVVRDIQRPKKIILTILIAHLLSPLIILMCRPWFDPEIYLGLIIASVVPSGISVIFLAKLFGGDASRALIITTISSLLSPITVPMLVLIFAQQDIDVNPLSMSFTIIKLIVIPFLAAQYVAHTHWKKRLAKKSNDVLIWTLLLLIIGIISPVRNYLLDNLLLSLVLAGFVGMLSCINFLTGFYVGRAPEARASYGLSASFKNFALANVLAFSLFNSTVALPAIVYAVINSFMLIPIQWFIEGQLQKKPA